MRIYETAKQFGVTSKDLIEILSGAGFDVQTHMSVVSDDALAFLNKKYSKTAPVTPKSLEKKEQEKTPEKKSSAKNKPAENKKSVAHKAPAKASIEKKIEVKEVAPVVILKAMTLSELAGQMQKPVTELITTLLKQGVVYGMNQILPVELVETLAEFFEIPIQKTEEASVAVKSDIAAEENFKNLKSRAPVVAVLGHVDHGKTSLLDFIRKTRVALKEKGGITQHLGAYQATTSHGPIVFLDTPGHEAFSLIRERGVRAADIVILVIAADDSIMPQTVEAIKYAKSMETPIVVAINKMDKVDEARIEVVRRGMSQYDLLPEEWGGDVISVPVSAKTGKGVDKLLEMISLQAEMMDLKADASVPARGFVLESKVEVGRGAVATIICKHGTLQVGDYFVCGKTVGRVTSMTNSYNERLKSVGPSIPVLVAGFEALPAAGDFFEVVSAEEYKNKRFEKPASKPFLGFDFGQEYYGLILKGDTHSSVEAIEESINKLNPDLEGDKKFKILERGVGGVTEGDVAMADSTKSLIVAFNVKTDPGAIALAKRNHVVIKHYNIIYRLLDELQEIAKAGKTIEMEWKKTGEAVIRKVFAIKGVGVVAGAYANEGVLRAKGSKVMAWRGKQKIGEGTVDSLQRDKKNVKEVHAGYECAFLIKGIDDWQVDDRAEFYIEVPKLD
ncbi:MAG: Translation initiation factor IF-2 [candidate division TM6 bacterium GW2011_GWF2_32_72]|nr:MAG: Translation initiation factor IF-2 [candidate division TM6 bacterium GW2011_GWF2_32_72]